MNRINLQRKGFKLVCETSVGHYLYFSLQQCKKRWLATFLYNLFRQTTGLHCGYMQAFWKQLLKNCLFKVIRGAQHKQKVTWETNFPPTKTVVYIGFHNQHFIDWGMHCPAPRKQHVGYVSDQWCSDKMYVSKLCLFIRHNKIEMSSHISKNCCVHSCKARELLLLYESPRVHNRASFSSLMLLWAEPDLRVCEVNSHLPLTVKKIWK